MSDYQRVIQKVQQGAELEASERRIWVNLKAGHVPNAVWQEFGHLVHTL